VRVLSPTPAGLRTAVGWLNASQPVGMPTETVYGLAAPYDDVRAVAAVYEAKRRPHFDPLIVHLASSSGLEAVADLSGFSDTERRTLEVLVQDVWPGPLTLVLPKRAVVPDLVTSGHATVAVRCPDHAVARGLIELLGRPVVAPSANVFGRVSPTAASHVVDELGDCVVGVLDGGPCPVGVESTIVQMLPGAAPVLLRPGGLPLERLRETLGEVATSMAGDRIIAPGQLAHHYAPATAMVCWSESVAELSDAVLEERLAGQREPVALLVFADLDGALARRVARRVAADVRVVPLSLDGSWVSVAHRLFATLREADASDCTRIVVEGLPRDHGLAPAVHDRITRASRGRL